MLTVMVILKQIADQPRYRGDGELLNPHDGFRIDRPGVDPYLRTAGSLALLTGELVHFAGEITDSMDEGGTPV